VDRVHHGYGTTQHPANPSPRLDRRFPVAPVLGDSVLDALDTLPSLGSGALSPVQPAAAVSHRWTLAGCPAPSFRSAPRGLCEIPWRVSIFQPAASIFTYFR